MLFASVGDLKRCTILARTAKQLYGADISDCQDWDARRPLCAPPNLPILSFSTATLCSLAGTCVAPKFVICRGCSFQ